MTTAAAILIASAVLLRRAGFGRPAIDIDQRRGLGHLDVNRTAAGKRDGRRQRFVKQRVEVDRPLAFRFMNDLGIGKRGADFRDGAGLIDENAVGRGQRARKRGGKGRGRIKPGRRIEARGTLADIQPTPCQTFCLLDDRAARREFEQAEPDRRFLQGPLTSSPHTPPPGSGR